MSYIGSDNEQDNKGNQMSEFRRQRSTSNLKNEKSNHWLEKPDDTDSEVSENHFLAKGAFLLTPSNELTIEKAAVICEKMNFKGCYSLTKTATGILFKFSHPEDYQNIFKKGFHKVTGARFYKKVRRSLTKFILEICGNETTISNMSEYVKYLGSNTMSSTENVYSLCSRCSGGIARGRYPICFVQV